MIRFMSLSIDGREQLFQFVDDWFVLGHGGQVFPFVGIDAVIVQFFAAVGITDVALALGPDGVILEPVCHPHRVIPLSFWIPEQGNQAPAIEFFSTW